MRHKKTAEYAHFAVDGERRSTENSSASSDTDAMPANIHFHRREEIAARREDFLTTTSGSARRLDNLPRSPAAVHAG